MAYERKRKPYHAIFFAANGFGPFICRWCGDEVDAWDESIPLRTAKAFCVHHVDHDHDNNDPTNLVAMHYGCHISYHRTVRPLVEKGQKLPDEWKRKITESLAAWREEMSADKRQEWLEKTQAGIASIDRTLLNCPDCGDGPFQGTHGISMHKRKGSCDPENLSGMGRKRERSRGSTIYCGDCPAGPFANDRALRTHVTWCSKARYTSSERAINCPDCGAGPYKSQRSVNIHKGMGKCASSRATD